jgi:hypothetical protein
LQKKKELFSQEEKDLQQVFDNFDIALLNAQNITHKLEEEMNDLKKKLQNWS